LQVKTKFDLSLLLIIIIDFSSRICAYWESKGLDDDFLSIPTMILAFICAYLLYDVALTLEKNE